MWQRSLLVSSLLLLSLNSQGSCPLSDGDLVFIKSQSTQASLLKIATGSEWSHVGIAFKQRAGWEIIEAVGPVQWTTLYSFIRRSRDLHFEVRRPNFNFDSKKIKDLAEKQLGADYDLIFAWDSKRQYCTELAWKAYKDSTGEEIGALERIGDLKVDHPMVMAEAKKRFESYNMSFDPVEWKASPIITPVQMLNASNLFEVTDHNGSSKDLQDCLK